METTIYFELDYQGEPWDAIKEISQNLGLKVHNEGHNCNTDNLICYVYAPTIRDFSRVVTYLKRKSYAWINGIELESGMAIDWSYTDDVGIYGLYPIENVL